MSGCLTGKTNPAARGRSNRDDASCLHEILPSPSRSLEHLRRCDPADASANGTICHDQSSARWSGSFLDAGRFGDPALDLAVRTVPQIFRYAVVEDVDDLDLLLAGELRKREILLKKLPILPKQHFQHSSSSCESSQFSQDQIRLTRIHSDFDPFDLRVVLIVRPDRVAEHGAAVEAVDHAQPVNGGVDPTQPGVDRRDRLRPRHVVNVDFQKTAEWNSCRPPCFIFPTNGNL